MAGSHVRRKHKRKRKRKRKHKKKCVNRDDASTSCIVRVNQP